MKVIISPSKTMKPKESNINLTIPMYQSNSSEINDWLKEKSLHDIKEYYKTSDKLSVQVMTLITEYDQCHFPAILAYQGTQFQHAQLHELSDQTISFLQEHLYIASGLYGLLKPFDRISLYRLPMELSFNGKPLTEYWKPLITSALRGEIVVNLCSEEYSSAIDQKELEYITIEFRTGVYPSHKVHSMEAKKMRGMMLHYIYKNNITQPNLIKHFNENGYYFDQSASNPKTFVFIKRDDS
jgi:uncharacterized protein